MTTAPRNKFVLLCAIGTGLVFAWAALNRPRSCGKDWVLASRATLAKGTHTDDSKFKVTFRVSNVGPHSVDFRVYWFECRAKTDRTRLATNQLDCIHIPLRPGESTNLAMDAFLGSVPVADCWCCYQVEWFQREAPVRDGAGRLWRRCSHLLGEESDPPWPRERLLNGCVSASNVGVADYFDWMYGWTRTQWLEHLAQAERAKAQPRTNGETRMACLRGEGPAAVLDNKAWMAFALFCQHSTNWKSAAEQKDAPNERHTYRRGVRASGSAAHR